jgi:hypothetical protein
MRFESKNDNGDYGEFRELSDKIRDILKDHPDYNNILFHKDDKIIDLFTAKLDFQSVMEDLMEEMSKELSGDKDEE